MNYLNAGSNILNGVAGFIKGIFETVATATNNFLDKISVKRVNFTFDVLVSESKKQLIRPEVARVAVCDLKRLAKLNGNVSEWSQLYINDVTHMIVTIGHRGEITEAYFYHDLSNYGNRQVDELINKTGEGMIIISA